MLALAESAALGYGGDNTAQGQALRPADRALLPVCSCLTPHGNLSNKRDLCTAANCSKTATGVTTESLKLLSAEASPNGTIREVEPRGKPGALGFFETARGRRARYGTDTSDHQCLLDKMLFARSEDHTVLELFLQP